jgi:hypothetical protein
MFGYSKNPVITTVFRWSHKSRYNRILPYNEIITWYIYFTYVCGLRLISYVFMIIRYDLSVKYIPYIIIIDDLLQYDSKLYLGVTACDHQKWYTCWEGVWGF